VAAPVRRLAARTRRQVRPSVAERRHDEGAAMSWNELAGLALSTLPDDRSPLSPREAEVTELVAQGLANGEIAAKLSISRRTVESHLDHVRQKLSLRNRHQIMLWALQESPPPRPALLEPE
jgi:DNA-binding CsgD family transcriptional regulator